jgi:NAD(P)H dehydrogenase (quinone)
MMARMENQSARLARVLVLYFSRLGHTKMMADLVVEGASLVPETEVRLRSVAEATAEDLAWCDGIAVGSPTHMGTIAWEMKRWWDEVAQPLWPEVEGKLGCAFSSSGGMAGGGELTCVALQIVLMNYGILVFGVPDYVGPGQTLHYGAICAGKPRNEPEREACRRLGRRLAEWVQTFILHRPQHDPRGKSYRKFTG